MEKKSENHFSYPSNLHELDLATLVSMYRDRGIPKKAKPGDYFACAETHKLIKDGKWWFGLYYSQTAWDGMLTKGSEGYPLTEVEMNIMGTVYASDKEALKRKDVEQHSGVVSKLAYMIVNDLKEYGFLSLDDNERLLITPRGEKALQGLTQRLFNRKFHPDMLNGNRTVVTPSNPIDRADSEESDQATLF